MAEKKKTKRQQTLVNVAQYVLSRGGRVMPNSIEPLAPAGTHHRMSLQCERRHVWKAAPREILHARDWCPQCVRHLIEESARAILQATYGSPFRRYAIGAGVLAGYCSRLNLAFQSEPPTCEPDEIEDEAVAWCRAGGVRVIQLPFLRRPTLRAMTAVISSRLAVIDPARKVKAPNRPLFGRQLSRLRKLAGKRGGSLVSTEYVGENGPHRWRCDRTGHGAFTASVFDVKLGRWCSRC